MAAAGPQSDPEPREARDVLAFGREVGRVLSDGRIVARAEPFAKVLFVQPRDEACRRPDGLGDP
jgi:hypothetical protein